MKDPRHWQMTMQALLLAWGLFGLDFTLSAVQIAASIAATLATQYAFSRWHRVGFEPRSALISGLSLCLLLRTDAVALAALAGVLTIASKFVLRVGGKHLWNPANFGLVALMLVTDRVWASPAQWGSAPWSACLVAGLGGLVVYRAARWDITIASLGSWAAVVLARTWWLGDPLPVAMHMLRSGSLLVFAFFMISDPRTTPDSRTGRIVFATLVSLAAGVQHFVLWGNDGLILALFGLAPLVPLLDRLFPAPRHTWEPAHEKIRLRLTAPALRAAR